MRNFVKLLLSIGFIAILFGGCASRHVVIPLEQYSLSEDEQRQILNVYCEKIKKDQTPKIDSAKSFNEALKNNEGSYIACSDNKMTITSKKYTTDMAIIFIKDNKLDVNCPKQYCSEIFYSSVSKNKVEILSHFKDYSTNKPIISKYIEDMKLIKKPTFVLRNLPKNDIYNKLVNSYGAAFESNSKLKKSLTPLSVYVEYFKSSDGKKVSLENLQEYYPISTIPKGISSGLFYHETEHKYWKKIGAYKDIWDITKNSYNSDETIYLDGTLYYYALNASNLNLSTKNVAVKYQFKTDYNVAFYIDNLTNDYMEINSISVYIGDIVYSKNINVKLPPNAINYYVSIPANGNSAYSEVIIETFNETINLGVGLDYSVNGKRDTLLQRKNVKVPNSI